MIHIYIYAANRLWDTDRISRLRRPPLKRRAITHFGEKHVRLGPGWVVGKQEVILENAWRQQGPRRIPAWSVPRFAEAAERCGLHRTYYSGVERGIRNVSLVIIRE